jgi:signal peptidase I, archaeal type
MGRTLDEIDLAFHEKHRRKTIAEIDKAFQEKHRCKVIPSTDEVMCDQGELEIISEIDNVIREKYERDTSIQIDNSSLTERIKKIHNAEGSKSPSRAFIISEVIFYVALIAMVLCTGLFFSGNLPGRMIGNSRFFEMLTPSMESVYPQGSLLIVGEIPAKELQVGDDISYVKDTDTVVTHRIVEIKENYGETGEPTFITRGVDNPANDPEAVLAKDVIGRVNNSIPVLGAILSWVARYLLFILVAFLIFMTGSFGIQIFWRMNKRAKR